MKLAFYDLETTGTDKEKNGVHQIAMILKTDSGESGYNFSVRPREGCVGKQEALDVCGKTVEELKAYPPMREVHGELTNVLGLFCDKFDKRDKFFLVGYNNRGFDDEFFRRWFADCGDNYYGSWFWPNTIDVMVLASQHLIERRPEMPNFKLHTVATELGIEIDETKLHDAMYDVNLTKQMYEILTRPKAIPDGWTNLMDGKKVSDMTDAELRDMANSWGSVVATYDPVRGKNIVSIKEKTA